MLIVDGRSCRKILSILNSIDFSLDYPAALELDIFSVPHVEQVINSCEQRNEEGLALCNVKNLHRTLVRECNGMTGALSSQSPIILRVSSLLYFLFLNDSLISGFEYLREIKLI